jgi:hypothetical protein
VVIFSPEKVKKVTGFNFLLRATTTDRFHCFNFAVGRSHEKTSLALPGCEKSLLQWSCVLSFSFP